MKNLKTYSISAFLVALAGITSANAETANNDQETLKVQNGVKVTTNNKSDDIPITYDFPNSTMKPVDPASIENKPAATATKTTTPAPAATPKAEEKKEVKAEEAKEEKPETTKMKPIIATGANATKNPSAVKAAARADDDKKDDDGKPAVAEKKTETKKVEPAPSPFKKSADANVKETVKKPDPKPEVKSAPLAGSVKKQEEQEDVSEELKKIESAKPGKDADDKDEAKQGGTTVGESGLPIPRFVSLKSGEINARTGPGENYPIRWVYQRKNLPVEVTAEFKLWRRIKDFDGEQTWVHQAMLSSRRYALMSRDATAYSGNERAGSAVAKFKQGVQVKLNECSKDYCQVEYGNIEGWVKKKDVWGAYSEEAFN